MTPIYHDKGSQFRNIAACRAKRVGGMYRKCFPQAGSRKSQKRLISGAPFLGSRKGLGLVSVAKTDPKMGHQMPKNRSKNNPSNNIESEAVSNAI